MHDGIRLLSLWVLAEKRGSILDKKVVYIAIVVIVVHLANVLDRLLWLFFVRKVVHESHFLILL